MEVTPCRAILRESAVPGKPTIRRRSRTRTVTDCGWLPSRQRPAVFRRFGVGPDHVSMDEARVGGSGQFAAARSDACTPAEKAAASGHGRYCLPCPEAV